ncbi:MAG: hypothetical protein JWR01_908, partial [Subtercola sp.]|nr:hypothetical protein [Subtercola sp.]
DFATDAKGVATFTSQPAFSSMAFTVYIAPKAGSGLQPGYWDGKPSAQTVPRTITPGAANLKYVARAGTAASIAGSVSGSGSPAIALPGVKVTALTASGSEAGSAVTSASGSYAIPGLSADSYTLRFDNPNTAYVRATWWKNKPSQQAADVFAVATSQALTGQNIVLDTVTAITGTVKGAGTTPVALANVNVLAVTAADSQFVASTSTDANGAYVLVLPAGASVKINYGISNNPGFLFSTWWKNKSTQETGNTITVATGRTAAGKDIVIDRVASISGRISGAGYPAVPLGGASVTAYTSAGAYAGYGYADQTGKYTVSGLAAGSYTLYFSNSGNASFVQHAWWNNKASRAEADSINVLAGQAVTGKNIVLPHGNSISGTVRGAGTPATALSGVSVVAYSGDDTNAAAMATTDSNGAYTLSGLIAGSYRLQFYSNASPTYVANIWWNKKASRAAATVIPLTAGTPVTGQDIVLPKGASIAGTVRGGGPPVVPLANVFINVHAADGSIVNSVVSDSTGHYSIGGLPAGSYTLEFDNSYGDPSYALRTWWRNKASQATANPISLAAGTVLTGEDVTFAKAAGAPGTVTDQAATLGKK